jgi:hypothetical protein
MKNVKKTHKAALPTLDDGELAQVGGGATQGQLSAVGTGGGMITATGTGGGMSTAWGTGGGMIWVF